MTETTNKEYEAGLIGLICFDALRSMPLIMESGLTADWFSCDKAKAAYGAATSLFAKGAAINTITIADAWDEPECHEYLEHCVDVAPVVAHSEYYIERVHNAHLLRLAQRMAHNNKHILDECKADEADATIASLSMGWQTLTMEKPDDKTLTQVGIELLDSWESGDEGGVGVVGWPLPTMQRLIGNLTDDLVFIYSKESTGKTAWTLQMALEIAKKGHLASILSLESKKPKLVMRWMSQIAQVNSIALKHRKSSPSQYRQAREAAIKLDALPLNVCDAGMTIDQVAAWASIEKQKGAKILFLDNLRHVRGGEKYKSPVEWFRTLSLRLKWIKDDVGIPFVVLHHSNAEGDVSWSSDVRRDADMLIRLTDIEEESIEPSAANDWIGRSFVSIDVKKSRDGLRGFSVKTEFLKDIQTFVEA